MGPVGVVKLLVVDDHPVVGHGVALLLRDAEEIEVVGVAATAREGVEAARRTQPDVILLDLHLPDMLVSDVIPPLRAAARGVRIVIFTAYRGEPARTPLRSALRVGVEGYVLKDVAETDLVDVVRKVMAGVRVADPRLDDAESSARWRSAGPPLTPREYEVLRHAAMGRTNPEIADAIGLARNTVKTYLQTAFQKLGVRNRVEAVARAADFGLL